MRALKWQQPTVSFYCLLACFLLAWLIVGIALWVHDLQNMIITLNERIDLLEKLKGGSGFD